MRLTDLDPRWILRDGKRVGFTFRCPTNAKWRQSCFVVVMPMRDQWDLFEEVDGEDCTQGCNPTFAWTVKDGIDGADFASITVIPSLDGSKGGLWHGFITRGEIIGEIPA